MVRSRFSTSTGDDLPEPDDIIADCGGNENPLQFLAMKDLDTAVGLIRGIEDLKRLYAWRRAELQFVDPPRDTILDALDDRERELTGEEPRQARDTEPEAEPATEPEQKPTEADDRPHASVTDVLPPGRVLEIDRGEKVEYIWPAREDTESPYLSQAIDVETETVRLVIGVDADEVEQRRRSSDHAVVEATDVTVEPPGQAVTKPEVSA